MPATQKSFAQNETLTKIRGMGVTNRRRLTALGIQSVKDLANAAAPDLHQQLQHQGYTVSQDQIGAWIAQAQALMQPLSPTDTALPVLPDNSNHDAAIAPDPIDPPIEPIWQPFASFVIEFQTRSLAPGTAQQTVIRHLETDTVEVWSGFTTEPVQPWMNAKLQTQFQMAPQAIAAPVTVEIGQLRLLRSRRIGLPMMVDHTRRLFPEAIPTGEPFTLEASMQLLGLPTDGNSIGHQIIYRTQCYARHLETGTILTLGDAIANVPLGSRVGYTASLTDLVLHQPGSYRLQVVITIQNLLSTPGCFKVPLLNVM